MIESGLARLLRGDGPTLSGRRVGLLVNPTAIDADYRHAIDRIAALPGVTLTALFGPEHGVRGDAQDMITVEDARDPATGVPCFSLYGHTEASLTPTPAMLDLVDVLVYDVQDVGARYYTFVWTMVLAMRACARAGKTFVVLDRPNPIGGDLVEGGDIAPGYESFVGLVSCPNRHGLTAGEIARWRQAEERLDVDLHVVAMQGWGRTMYFGDTGLPWVLPSPNMPTVDTALVYPGMCLVEGTELSEARGSTRPFELSGAPFIDGPRLAADMRAMLATLGPSGCVLRPVVYTPMFHKHGKQPNGGIQIHVTDRAAFRPYRTGVAFVKACRDQAPAQFAWRSKAYEFVDKIPAFDLLCGSPDVRLGIEAGAPLADLEATWAGGAVRFVEARAPYLMYRSP